MGAAARSSSFISLGSILPNAAGAGEQDAAADDGAPTVPARGVKMVDPNEMNELDLAAAPTTAEASWLSYLLATLGAALAAASSLRFLVA